MKTLKEKPISKPKKTAITGKSEKGKNVTSFKSGPTEEEIRKKAREIYYERMASGEYGTPEDDWLEAEEFLRKISG